MSGREGAVVTVFLRSFLIQGAWNYRDLIGIGVAWALLPFRPRSEGGAALDEGAQLAVDAEPFNAHPYLSPVALGALARARLEGEEPGRTRAFRNAIRSPLGGLGDALLWSAWRPFCVLLALFALLLGAGPGTVLVLFVAAWNVVHLVLRLRAAVLGVGMGLRVAEGIRALRLPLHTERIAATGVLLLGFVGGGLLARGAPPHEGFPIGIAGMGLFFLAGWIGGAALGRRAPLLLLFLAAMATWRAIG